MKKTVLGTLLLSGMLFALMGNGATAKAEEVKENDNVFYVVESGDTLSAIADKYGVDFTVIHGNNEDTVSHADVIEVGQKLLVDGKDFDKEKYTAYAVPVAQESVQEVSYSVEQTYVEPTYVEDNSVAYSAPVAQAPAYSGNSSSAKEWIAQRESNGSYSAMNGRYVGRYQLTDSYLNGDYSPENQERVADQYVADRYGSWENAQSFWMSNGWY